MLDIHSLNRFSKLPTLKHRYRVVYICLSIALWSSALSPDLFGQEVAPTKPNPDVLVATVDGMEIQRQQVINRIPNYVSLKKQLDAAELKKLESVALEVLIDQRIAFAYLKAYGQTVGESEVQIQLDALTAELAKYEKSLEGYCAEQNLTQQQLQHQITFRASWKKYLAAKLTDENLKLHFNRNRRKFDGTDVRVAHLLLKLNAPSGRDKTMKQAEDLVQQLRDGTLAWNDAVKQFSAGTKINDGELGTVLLKPVMPTAFIEAARPLDQNQFSDPVETAYGIHVIHCLEVIPGTIDFGDAREKVTQDARKFLFKTIVDRHRGKVKVEMKQR
ncbi:MAG: peptidylprolyl isomerase [Planctomycetota bacterium]